MENLSDEELELRYNELELPPEQRWENLDISNDFMFFKVMHNAKICRGLLSRILPDIEIGRIRFVETQKTMRDNIDSRSVRFDVYAKSDKRLYNIEMQNVNEDDLPKRIRCYHAAIDNAAMKKGSMKMYADMPEAFVIFICKFDLFNKGRHIYTFKNFCCEDKSIELKDCSTSIFLNAKGIMNDVSPELKAFLNLVLGKSSDDKFVKDIEEILSTARHSSEWRREYIMTSLWLRDRDEKQRIKSFNEGKEQGLQEGEERGIIKVAKSMLLGGANISDILRYTGLSLEELKSL